MIKKQCQSTKLGKIISFFFIPFVFSTALSSCGLLGKSHSRLKIAVPFTTEDNRSITIKYLTNQYNEWIETHSKKSEGYLPVDVYNTTDLDNNKTQILNQLSTKDYDSLPNLSFGYGNNIYDLAFNGNYLLDFSKSTKEAYNNQNNYSDDKIEKSIFSNSFLQMNKIIDNTKKDGLYLIPSGASVDTLFVNRTVLNYLLKNIINSDQVTIKSDDVQFFKQEFGIEKNGTIARQQSVSTSTSQTPYSVSTDKTNTAKAAYGDPDLNSIKSSIELSISMFENYEDFFKLANFLNNAYPHKTGSILGYYKTNAYELGAFLKGNAEYDDFLWNKKHKEQTYNYSFYGENAGEGRSKNLKEVYDLFYGLKDHNGLWKQLTPNSDYQDNFSKNEVLFCIGTIARFRYYLSENPTNGVEEKDIFLTLNPYKYNSASTGSGFYSQGGSFFGISFNNPKIDHATRLFMKWMLGETTANNNDSNKNRVKLKTDQDPETQEDVRPMTYYALNNNYMPGFNDFTTNTNNGDKFMKSFSKKFIYELFTKLNNAGVNQYGTAPPKPQPSSSIKNGEKFSWGITIPDVSSTRVFVEPVGELSGAFRNVTDSSESLGESHMPSFEEFWLRLRTNYQIQYWINKNQALIQQTKTKDATKTKIN